MRYFLSVLLVVGRSCLVSAAPTAKSSSTVAPVVTVRNGSYRGLYNEFYNQDFFLGIPYAQPPIDVLRFRTPQSLDSTWTSTIEATAYPKYCYGYGEDEVGHSFSEDCLYLNVFRPSLTGNNNSSNGSIISNTTLFKKQGKNPRNTTLLPVAVWIHGGGLFMGGTADQRYNMSFIIQNSVDLNKPMMVVSIQYRLSAWGFLGGAEALAEGATNIGYRDQRLALHWIQENIAAFGGDPEKVTLWGESSGAESIGAQLLAYNGRDDGLFRGAICESGGPGVSFFPTQLPGGYNSTVYQETYNHLVSNTSCASTLNESASSLHCLRSLPIEELNAALNISTYGLTPFAPFIDNDFVSTYPSVQLSRGDFVHVPLLTGSNTDEGTRFSTLGINNDTDWYTALNSTGIPFPPSLSPSAQLADNTTSTYNTTAVSTANTVSVHYPDDPSVGIPSIYMFPPSSASDNLTAILGTQFRRSSAYFGDLIVISPRRASNHAWSRLGVPNWSYRFDVLVNGFGDYEGSAHFAEVGFVFKNTEGLGYRDGEDPFDLSVLGDYASIYEALFDDLATMMSSAWVRMIVDGDPNGADGEGLGVPQGDSGSPNENLLWPEYGGNGSMGTNVVFTVYGNGSSVETDDYREEAIAWLADNALGVYGL